MTFSLGRWRAYPSQRDPILVSDPLGRGHPTGWDAARTTINLHRGAYTIPRAPRIFALRSLRSSKWVRLRNRIRPVLASGRFRNEDRKDPRGMLRGLQR